MTGSTKTPLADALRRTPSSPRSATAGGVATPVGERSRRRTLDSENRSTDGLLGRVSTLERARKGPRPLRQVVQCSRRPRGSPFALRSFPSATRRDSSRFAGQQPVFPPAAPRTHSLATTHQRLPPYTCDVWTTSNRGPLVKDRPPPLHVSGAVPARVNALTQRAEPSAYDANLKAVRPLVPAKAPPRRWLRAFWAPHLHHGCVLTARANADRSQHPHPSASSASCSNDTTFLTSTDDPGPAATPKGDTGRKDSGLLTLYPRCWLQLPSRGKDLCANRAPSPPTVGASCRDRPFGVATRTTELA